MSLDASLPRGLRAILWVAFALYVVTLPISNTIALRNVAFAVLAATTIYAAMRNRLKLRLPLALPWLAYATVALISLTYAVDRPYSTRYLVSEIGFSALVFVVAYAWSRRMPVVDGLVAIITALNATSLILLVSLYPLSEIWNVTDLHRELIDLPLAKVALNSNFLIAIMPIIAYGAWRLYERGKHKLASLLGLLLAADLVALLASGNRQNMVALAASMLCITPFLPRETFTRKRVAAFLLLAAAIAGLFFIQLMRRMGLAADEGVIAATIQTDPRWDLWRFSIERILENPWYGGGFGRGVFDKLYAYYRPEDASLWHAHNMILNKGIQMGIPGMVAFIWLWAALAKRLARYSREPMPARAVAITGLAIAAGVFMKNMSDDFFFRDPALLFWLQMGVVLGTSRRLKDTTA